MTTLRDLLGLNPLNPVICFGEGDGGGGGGGGGYDDFQGPNPDGSAGYSGQGDGNGLNGGDGDGGGGKFSDSRDALEDAGYSVSDDGNSVYSGDGQVAGENWSGSSTVDSIASGGGGDGDGGGQQESFGDAFSRNRAAGNATFEWNGGTYTTQTAEEVAAGSNVPTSGGELSGLDQIAEENVTDQGTISGTDIEVPGAEDFAQGAEDFYGSDQFTDPADIYGGGDGAAMEADTDVSGAEEVAIQDRFGLEAPAVQELITSGTFKGYMGVYDPLTGDRVMIGAGTGVDSVMADATVAAARMGLSGDVAHSAVDDLMSGQDITTVANKYGGFLAPADPGPVTADPGPATGENEISLDRLEDMASYTDQLTNQMGSYTDEDLDAAGFTAAEIEAFKTTVEPAGLTAAEISELRAKYGDINGIVYFDPLVDTFGADLGSLIRSSGGLFTEMTGNLFTQFGDAYNYVSGAGIGADNYFTEMGQEAVDSGKEIQERALSFLERNSPETYADFMSPIVDENGNVNLGALKAKAIYSSIPTVLGLAGIPFGVIPAVVTGGLMTAAEIGTEARNEAYDQALQEAKAAGMSDAEAEDIAMHVGRSANLVGGALGVPVGAISNKIFSGLITKGITKNAISNLAGAALLSAADEGWIEQSTIASAVNAQFEDLPESFGDVGRYMTNVVESRVSLDEAIMGGLTGGAVTAASYAKAKVAGMSDQQISDQIKSTPEGELVEFTTPTGETIQGGTVPYSSIMASGNPIEVRTNADGVSQIVDTVTGDTVDIPAGTEINFGDVPTGNETTVADVIQTENNVIGGQGQDVTVETTGGQITLTNTETGMVVQVPASSDASIIDMIDAVQRGDGDGVQNMGGTVTVPAQAETSELSAVVDAVLSGMPATVTAQEVSTEINAALAGMNNLSVAEVQEVVTNVVSGLEGLTSADVRTVVQDIVDNQTNLTSADVEGLLSGVSRLTAADVQEITQEALDGLPEGATPAEVAALLNDSIGALNDLSAQEVSDIVTAAVGSLENMSQADIASVVQGVVDNQTVVSASDVEQIVSNIARGVTSDLTQVVGDALSALPEAATAAEVSEAINTALSGINDLSATEVTTIMQDIAGSMENLSAQDVTDIVQGIVDNQTVVTAADIQGIVNSATAVQTGDFSDIVNNALNALPEAPTIAEITTAITDAVGGLTNLSPAEVSSIVSDYTGALENLSAAEVASVVQGIVDNQTVVTTADIQGIVDSATSAQTADFSDIINNALGALPEDPTLAEITTAINDAIGGQNNLSAAEVTSIVSDYTGALENLSSAEVASVVQGIVDNQTVVTAADIQGIVDNATAMQTEEFSDIINEALGALPEDPTLAEITVAINDAIGDMNDLSAAEVTSIVSDYTGALENLSAAEVASVVQGIVDNQTVVTAADIQGIVDRAASAQTSDFTTIINNALDALPADPTLAEIKLAINDAIGGQNDLSAEEVTSIVSGYTGALENLSAAEVADVVQGIVDNQTVVTAADVQGIVANAAALQTADFTTIINNALGALPEDPTLAEITTAINDAIGGQNDLSAAEVTSIVSDYTGALENLSSAEVASVVQGIVDNQTVVTTADIQGIVDRATSAQTSDFTTIINNALDALPADPTLDQIKLAINDAIGGQNDLSAEEVTSIVSGYTGALENLSAAEVADVVQGIVDNQTVVTAADIQGIVANAAALQTADFTTIINNALDALPADPTLDQIKLAINDAIGGQNDLSAEEVTSIVSGYTGALENLSAAEVADVVQGIVDNQTVVTAADVQGIVDRAAESINLQSQVDLADLESSIKDVVQQTGVDVGTALDQVVNDLAATTGQSTDQILNALGTTQEAIVDKVSLQLEINVSDLQNEINQRINELEAQNVDRAEASRIAVSEVATSLGTTETTLLNAMETTQASIVEGVSDVSQQVTDVSQQVTEQTEIIENFDSRVTELVEQGNTTSEAVSTAVAEIAAQLNTTTNNVAEILAVLDREYGPDAEPDVPLTDTSATPTDVLPGGIQSVAPGAGYSVPAAMSGGMRPTAAPYYQPQQVGLPSLYAPIPGVDQTPQQGYIAPAETYLAPTGAPQYGYGSIAPNTHEDYLRTLAELQGTGAENVTPEETV